MPQQQRRRERSGGWRPRHGMQVGPTFQGSEQCQFVLAKSFGWRSRYPHDVYSMPAPTKFTTAIQPIRIISQVRDADSRQEGLVMCKKVLRHYSMEITFLTSVSVTRDTLHGGTLFPRFALYPSSASFLNCNPSPCISPVVCPPGKPCVRPSIAQLVAPSIVLSQSLVDDLTSSAARVGHVVQTRSKVSLADAPRRGE